VEVDTKISTRVVAELQLSSLQSRLGVLGGNPSLLGHGRVLRDLPPFLRFFRLPLLFLARVLLHDALKFVLVDDRERSLISPIFIFK